MRSASVGPSTSSMTRAWRRVGRILQPVDGGDVLVVERRQDLRFSLESGETLAVLRERVGKDLERDLAAQLGVPGAIHLTHAAHTERPDDFVGAQARAAREGHREAITSRLVERISDFYSVLRRARGAIPGRSYGTAPLETDHTSHSGRHEHRLAIERVGTAVPGFSRWSRFREASRRA